MYNAGSWRAGRPPQVAPITQVLTGRLKIETHFHPHLTLQSVSL